MCTHAPSDSRQVLTGRGPSADEARTPCVKGRERRGESGRSVRDDESNALQRPQSIPSADPSLRFPRASLAAVIDVALQRWCTVAAICTATSGISLYIPTMYLGGMYVLYILLL